jgi:hypothetical protein
MKVRSTFAFCLFFLLLISCQRDGVIIPDLSEINESGEWHIHNRNISVGEEVYLDANEGDGILLNQEIQLSNGAIELDIRGKDVRGKSFVGLAFHGVNDSTYDVIYFRPFNFKDSTRYTHSVQYISHPTYTWHHLRGNYPEVYENEITPAPEPEEWIHAKIVIEHPIVKVFVNNSKEPSLEVEQLNSREVGWLGFWVGNGSDGYFKNLRISHQE